jgi:hypothetical protein
VITDFGVGLSGKQPENSKGVGSASSCKPYREIIELGLSWLETVLAEEHDSGTKSIPTESSCRTKLAVTGTACI